MGVLLRSLCSGQTSPTPDQMPATVSTGLRQVIATATAANPAQRYESAAKLRDALAALNASSSGAAQSRKRRLRARVMWMVAAILLLCAVAAVVPQVRREVQARVAGTSRVGYEDYLAAEDALLRYDKPGNTQKAIELYQQTLERSPNFALAQAGLARGYWRMYLDTSDKKWVDQSGQAAAQAATMNPNLAPVQMTLGMIHVEQGKAGLAMQELDQAKQLDPRSADVHAEIGEAYRQQGRLGDAKNELQTAIDLAPDNWRWPYLLAALQIDSGDLKPAESNLKLALEKTPDNARVLYNLGLVYRKQGRLEEAGKAYQQVLQLDGSYFQAAVALANVLTLQQRYDEAVAADQRAVEMRPADWRAWGSLGTAQEFNGRAAGEAYRKAVELGAPQLKITPDDPYLVSRMGRFYASLRDPEHALPLLRKTLVLASSDPDVLERVAESYELLGERDQALELGFSVEYGKKTPVFERLRKDPRAPLQLREAALQKKEK